MTLAAPVVVLDADDADTVRDARRLGFQVLPCQSGRLVVDGLPTAPQMRVSVLSSLGLGRERVVWAVAMDRDEPSTQEMRIRIAAAALGVETTVSVPAVVYALFATATDAESALCF